MTQLFRIEIVLPYLSGFSRDTAINTFHIATPDVVDPGDMATAIGIFKNYYENVLPGTSSPMGHFISEFVDRDSCRVDLTLIQDWDTNDPTFVPQAETALALDAGVDSMPLEVAVVCSQIGTTPYPSEPYPTSIRRRRGRHYIGPLGVTDVLVQGANGRPLIDPDFTAALGAANEVMVDSFGDLDDYAWVVYSRTEPGISIITRGFVNNEFDTQRRRGGDELDRIVWNHAD